MVSPTFQPVVQPQPRVGFWDTLGAVAQGLMSAQAAYRAAPNVGGNITSLLGGAASALGAAQNRNYERDLANQNLNRAIAGNLAQWGVYGRDNPNLGLVPYSEQVRDNLRDSGYVHYNLQNPGQPFSNPYATPLQQDTLRASAMANAGKAGAIATLKPNFAYGANETVRAANMVPSAPSAPAVVQQQPTAKAGPQMVYAAPPKNLAAVLKMPGPITSGFGVNRGNHTHNGADIALANGTPLTLPFGSKVLKAWTDSIGGNQLLVDIGNGETVGFAHLRDAPTWAPGAQIPAGTVLAHSGNTGRSTGPHAHVTYRRNGQLMDPVKYLFGQPHGGVAPQPVATVARVAGNVVPTTTIMPTQNSNDRWFTLPYGPQAQPQALMPLDTAEAINLAATTPVLDPKIQLEQILAGNTVANSGLSQGLDVRGQNNTQQMNTTDAQVSVANNNNDNITTSQLGALQRQTQLQLEALRAQHQQALEALKAKLNPMSLNEYATQLMQQGKPLPPELKDILNKQASGGLAELKGILGNVSGGQAPAQAVVNAPMQPTTPSAIGQAAQVAVPIGQDTLEKRMRRLRGDSQ